MFVFQFPDKPTKIDPTCTQNILSELWGKNILLLLAFFLRQKYTKNVAGFFFVDKKKFPGSL